MTTNSTNPTPSSAGPQPFVPDNGGSTKLSADKIAADAGALKDEARHVAESVASEARGVAESVANEARSQLDNVVSEVKERVADGTTQARDMANTEKDNIADQLGGLADAAQRVADDLESESAPGASYVRMVADNARKLTGTIRDSNVDDLLGMAEDFGRKQPVAFLGAAALLGFTASRFLTASAKRRQQEQISQKPGMESEGAPSNPATAPYGTPSYEGRA
jgi:hypothetical protein